MAYIPGSIPVTGFIGPTDDSDVYAVTDAIYGIDGYRSLSSTTVRNAITTERRREGMLVYTQNDQNVWQLLPQPWTGADSDWKLFISSGITALLTASTVGQYLPLSGGTGGEYSFTGSTTASTIFIDGNFIQSLDGLSQLDFGDNGGYIALTSDGQGYIQPYFYLTNDSVFGQQLGIFAYSGYAFVIGEDNPLIQNYIWGKSSELIINHISGVTIDSPITYTNRLQLQDSVNAPLNVPIFISDPSPLSNGDVWITSGSTGNALLNVRIGGVTKTVELT